jgi:hypothetical protein
MGRVNCKSDRRLSEKCMMDAFNTQNHKPEDNNGNPKRRSVCAAATCGNGRLSEMVSDILAAVMDRWR